MAGGPRYRVPFRRRREGKTDYRYRLRLLKSGLPRAVFRRSSRYITVQVVEYDREGDKITAHSNSMELKKYGWSGSFSSTPAAYLTGYLTGKKALKKGVKEAVFDMGIYVPSKGCRAFAGLRGLVDAGMEIPHGESEMPDDDRIKGAHLGDKVAEMFESVKAKLEEA